MGCPTIKEKSRERGHYEYGTRSYGRCLCQGRDGVRVKSLLTSFTKIRKLCTLCTIIVLNSL